MKRFDSSSMFCQYSISSIRSEGLVLPITWRNSLDEVCPSFFLEKYANLPYTLLDMRSQPGKLLSFFTTFPIIVYDSLFKRESSEGDLDAKKVIVHQ